ncbi:MAG: helix-hairpin-helix domain-containing protein [Tissierellales bacterium]|nr:helix-hairpin-helix domain-containing protein [Tissierellales bacterium]
MGYFSKREKILITIIAMLIIIIFVFRNPSDDLNVAKENNLVIINDESKTVEEEKNNEEIPSEIIVHISGQVYQPGIYRLFSGDRVIDVVNLAGGLTKDADLDKINLARKISDEDKIYIPKIGEDVNVNSNNSPPEFIESKDDKTSTSKININTCSKEELVSLPGIGDVLADRIIEYRNKTKFNEIEDIKKVAGIGDAKFNSIKDLITTK